MKRFKAYKYRLYPNKNQEVLLAKHFGASRWIYNYGLSRKIKVYTEEKKTLSRFDLDKELGKLKKQEETLWLSEVTAQCLQQSLINLDKAYTKFFRDKKGFPKFKSRKNKQSIQFPQYTKVDFGNNKLYVMKFREGIKCKFSRQFEGVIKTTTISKSKSNKYFASILVEEEIQEVKKQIPDINKAVGVDLGLKSFLVTSEGEVIDNPRYLKKSLKQLKREQKRFSRKQKGSKNREKQRIKVARVYEKVGNQRDDFLHKVSSQLVNDNQINTYCIEDLNIQGMLKNHKLAGAISNVSWGKFIDLLTYKANWAGKTILQIGRFEPSSRTCNVCGLVNHELTLKDREWTCKCGTLHNRDYLAACNIRDFAFDKQNLIGQESA